MAGQVAVDWARGHRPRSGEGERRERLRVVERGNLGDHPADADARQVRRPVIQLAGQCRSVGCKITQRVRRRLGIDGDRRTAIAQVIAHYVTRAQNQRRRRVTEVRDAKRDAVRLDCCHHTNPSAMTPEVRTEQIVGYIVASRAASWTGGAGNDSQAAHPRRGSSRRTVTTAVRSQG
jgi:hypothetical protein